MKWRIYILLVSFPLAYPVLFANYYVGKLLDEVNIKKVIRRNKELF